MGNALNLQELNDTVGLLASARMIAKAEQIEGKENPRYLVTSLGKEVWPA